MTLSEFLHLHRSDVVREWKAFACQLLQPSAARGDLVLADHIEGLIDALAGELENLPPVGSNAVLLRDATSPHVGLLEAAAQIHTTERIEAGFKLQQIVSEYRALRSSIGRMWRESPESGAPASQDMLLHLNDVIDQAVQHSVAVYSTEVGRSRDLLLGTLGHDLRNPLNAIAMRAALLARMSLSKEAQAVLSPMQDASRRMGQLIGDLLDVTRVRLGSGLDLHRVDADLGVLCAQSVQEVHSAHPAHPIHVHSSGDLRGCWDTTRILQVLTNILGNAVQHGKPDAPITVTLSGQRTTVACAIQNWGVTIAPQFLRRIFEPMQRVQAAQAAQAVQPTNTDSIGLGLYIANEIVAAHGGTLTVTSTDAEGTTFAICLHRARAQAAA